MRHRLLPGAALVLAGCAPMPTPPTAPSPEPKPLPRTAASEPQVAAAVAKHRKLAEAARQSGDLAEAAVQWHILTLLAPADAAYPRELAAARTGIQTGVKENLQVGTAALAAGDLDRASRSLLRVLALEPDNAEAARGMREIDRRRYARIQADRAAKVRQEDVLANRAGRAPTATPAMAGGDGDGFDLEQAIELLRAGDTASGLRELRAFVDANPGNRAARQRIGMAVAERARELEDQGASEQALALYEQASSLRGDGGGPWVARIAPLRKAVSHDYYERATRAYRTDLKLAISLLQTSVRIDPSNAQAASRLAEAQAAQSRLQKIDRDRQKK